VEGVPFNIADPTRTPGGRNLLVLKGGGGPRVFSKSFAQKVEVPVGVAVAKLHFLGGVGGWAWPWNGDSAKNIPVVKATVHFAGGNTEDLIFRNGVEFADYIREVDVPGSRLTRGLVRENQLRWFTVNLKNPGPVEKLVLESYDNTVAPTLVAITAELPGDKDVTQVAAVGAVPATVTAAATATAAVQPASGAIPVAMFGGGSSHDYPRWFDREDTAILKGGGLADPVYSDRPADFKALLEGRTVLYQSANLPIPDPATREAILGFPAPNRGVVLVHAGLWYNWRDWPEYNRVLCGGGARGHDRLGEFEVTVTAPDHPLMKGVPKSFSIVDELYYFEPDPQGTPIEVLATAHSKQRNKTYPMVFVVKHPKARVVGITLGHDGKAHELPAYRTLLRNAVSWAAGR